MSFIINVTNTSGESGTIIPDVGFSYTDNLSSINQSNLKISGSSQVKRSLLGVGSDIKIYRSGALEYRGIVDHIDNFAGGAIVVHSSGYEQWLALENGAYAGSPWTSTASATIFAAIIAESTKLSGGTIEAGTSVDFRAGASDSLWNVLSNLSEATQQDIGIDYTNSEIDILDHKGSSASLMTMNAGLQIEDLRVSQSYPIGNYVIVYGKSEGETRIKSTSAHGQDGTSQAAYGVITKTIQDPKINTEDQANILADALVAKYKDPIKVYDFDVINPNQSLVSGDVITLNATAQGISNENVRIVGITRGVESGEEYLTLEVTNEEYSKKIKSSNERVAQLEKLIRDQQTYDAYQNEYSNQNVDTVVGGLFNTCYSCTDVWFDSSGMTSLNCVRQVGNVGALTLGATAKIYLIASNGTGVCPVEVWGPMSMMTYKITDLGTPTANADAATKLYVDNCVAGAGSNMWADTTNPWIIPCNSCSVYTPCLFVCTCACVCNMYAFNNISAGGSIGASTCVWGALSCFTCGVVSGKLKIPVGTNCY